MNSSFSSSRARPASDCAAIGGEPDEVSHQDRDLIVASAMCVSPASSRATIDAGSTLSSKFARALPLGIQFAQPLG